MPEDVYFAQPRLGSSDFSKLSGDDPESWYWGSKHNPDREDSSLEEDLLVGKGLHAMCLEGVDAFEARFIKSPYDSYASGAAKAWKAEQLEKGLTPIKEKTYKNILLMGNILNNHPQLGPKMKGGLSEVTVLTTMGGIKVRTRFDKLLSDMIVDLKSVGRHKSSTVSPEYLQSRGITRDLHTCLRIIRDLKYGLQRYIYSLGREHMRDFIKDGRVHGATPAQLAWLQKIAEVESWQFWFVFFRKVSHNTKSPSAPAVIPIVSEMNDFLNERGYKMFAKAVEQYEGLVKRFGLDVGWAKFCDPMIVDDVVMLEMFGADGDQPTGTEPDEGDDDDDERDSAS